jgi:hypothetical protein
MRSKVLILLLFGLTLWGCGRVYKKFFYTKVECCENKASCCTTEMCCLPRYAGGTAPQVQLSAPVPDIPPEALEPSPEEKPKPSLLSRLNPLNYWWQEDEEEAETEESPGEKKRKEEETNFFGKLIPF